MKGWRLGSGGMPMPVVNMFQPSVLDRFETRVAQSITCMSMLKPASLSCCVTVRAVL
jgi:hypothetical protein